MNINQIIEQVIFSFNPIISILKIEYLELIKKEVSEEIKLTSLFKNVYNEDFSYLPLSSLENTESFISKLTTETFDIELKSKYEHMIQCKVLPIQGKNNLNQFLIIQSSKKFDENHNKLLKALVDCIIIINEQCKIDTHQIESAEKYKNELLNLRNMQAKLFPKFENINGLDIASAYLPAELMSGNFIDGFYINDDVYQLISCDVSSWASGAAFAGATIRTLLRSIPSNKMTPSSIIENIINKLKKVMPGLSANIYLTIYQINTKTGKVMLSSLGEISTVFYNGTKKQSVDLNDTSYGKIFSKRSAFKDMTLTIDPGDTLLYYSKSLRKKHSDENENPYGLNELLTTFKDNIDDSSLEIVHSIINSIYEFYDYQPLTEDIILINIKRV